MREEEDIPRIPLAKAPLNMNIACEHCQADIPVGRPLTHKVIPPTKRTPQYHILYYKCPKCGQGAYLNCVLSYEKYEECQVLDFNEALREKRKKEGFNFRKLIEWAEVIWQWL